VGGVSGAFDAPLLEVARIVLDRAGFATERLDLTFGDEASLLEQRTLLLAQDRFFILAVGSAATVADLGALEPAAVLELTHRAATSNLGAKQWDLYLVLLAEQSAPDDGRASTEIASLNYNTRSIRRLAHAGVAATVEAVERALRPFLPLPEISEAAVLEDALTLLEQALTAEGIDLQLAARAVAAFRETGSLSSV
jgi:hypothetical protein